LAQTAAFGNPRNATQQNDEDDIPVELQEKIHAIIERQVKSRINEEVYHFKMQIK
tara:strand:+ start:492 stop:656 length:165 start_codon:yes stop_codon:yes gene_type:complete